jgi:hypothetical protein
MPPLTTAPEAGSMGIWPDRNRKLPARIPGEYGPMALGVPGAENADGT